MSKKLETNIVSQKERELLNQLENLIGAIMRERIIATMKNSGSLNSISQMLVICTATTWSLAKAITDEGFELVGAPESFKAKWRNAVEFGAVPNTLMSMRETLWPKYRHDHKMAKKEAALVDIDGTKNWITAILQRCVENEKGGEE